MAQPPGTRGQEMRGSTEALFRATSPRFSCVRECRVRTYPPTLTRSPDTTRRRRNAHFFYSLTRELEKKLSDKFVVFVAQRRVLAKESRKSGAKLGQKRPRSRTLTAVHEKTLEDLVFPSEITGKRIRVAQDGHKVGKVFLDAKDQNTLEYKLDCFASVYKALAGKDVVFEFPAATAE